MIAFFAGVVCGLILAAVLVFIWWIAFTADYLIGGRDD
jgi:hypothetical protein